jgi:hypothetical protein
MDAMATALKASTDLATAMGGSVRLFRGVIEERAALPYVLIGEDQVIGDDEECGPASEVFATVNAWSKPNPPGASQIRLMGAAIRAALTTALSVTGHEVVDWEFQDANYSTDPDGSSRMRAVFHYFLTPSV